MTTTTRPPAAPASGSLARHTPRRSWSSAIPAPLLQVDLILVAAVVATAALGVLMVFSATRGTDDSPTTFFLQRQALFVLLGLGLMAVVAAFDYRRLRDWAVPAAVLAVTLLLGVKIIGTNVNGAQAWFQLGGFQFQPSEPAKLVLIVGLATLLTFDQSPIDVRRLLTALGLAAVPMGLIMLQPDLGTVLVFGAITLGMLLVAGARPRHFAVLTLVAIIGTVGILNSGVLADYQTARLTSFLDTSGQVDPGSTAAAARYNQEQSQVAIGAGGVTGQGLFDGTQTGLDFVPEQHTDFIFTVVGEELGFVGSLALLVLLGIIIWRVWRAAHLARDDFGVLLCAGVMALLLFQAFQNIGMAVGIMPITGIPLPLVSYGGSSILTVFAALGLVLSVHIRK